MHRVIVSAGSLYFIRLGGLISASDAGSGRSLFAQERAVAAVIGWFAKKTLDSGLSKIEGTNPEQLVASSRKHFKVTPDEVIESTLDPPSMFSGERPSFARWKVTVRGRKRTIYEIEDRASLETALSLLPPLLGDKLKVKVKYS
jgi:hypothetical protein